MLWRHGRTVWNLDGRIQGQADVPLDDEGLAQARRAAGLLAGLSPDAIVSSDLSRAADTASALAELLGLDVGYDPGLREVHLGTWQGLSRAEIAERFPDEWRQWNAGESLRRGGGESEEETADRVAGAVTRSLEKVPDDGTLVAVSHSAAIRLGIGRMLGLPPDAWSALGPLANCAWSVLGEAPRGWRLLEHNAGTLPEPVLADDR